MSPIDCLLTVVRTAAEVFIYISVVRVVNAHTLPLYMRARSKSSQSPQEAYNTKPVTLLSKARARPQ